MDHHIRVAESDTYTPQKHTTHTKKSRTIGRNIHRCVDGNYHGPRGFYFETLFKTHLLMCLIQPNYCLTSETWMKVTKSVSRVSKSPTQDHGNISGASWKSYLTARYVAIFVAMSDFQKSNSSNHSSLRQGYNELPLLKKGAMSRESPKPSTQLTQKFPWKTFRQQNADKSSDTYFPHLSVADSSSKQNHLRLYYFGISALLRSIPETFQTSQHSTVFQPRRLWELYNESRPQICHTPLSINR